MFKMYKIVTFVSFPTKMEEEMLPWPVNMASVGINYSGSFTQANFTSKQFSNFFKKVS